METVQAEISNQDYLARFRSGVWRDRIFRDMIFDDCKPQGRGLTFLDIGCGRGFDGDVPLQESIAQVAGEFIGVEPDTTVTPGPYFHRVHHCLFEDAPLPPESVDVAYAIMVLEHLARPQAFWDRVRQVLRPGGVFWGLTVDRRHWFCRCSLLLERLRLKEMYLNVLLGRRGQDRYENYPVYYRSNSPAQLEAFTSSFARCQCWSLSRVGPCNDYFPRLARPLLNAWDAHRIRANRPGTLLVVRVQK